MSTWFERHRGDFAASADGDKCSNVEEGKVETGEHLYRSEFIFLAKVYYRGFLPKVSGMSPYSKNEKKKGW